MLHFPKDIVGIQEDTTTLCNKLVTPVEVSSVYTDCPDCKETFFQQISLTENTFQPQMQHVNEMAIACENHLSASIGPIPDKSLQELVAWSRACIEMEQKLRQALLSRKGYCKAHLEESLTEYP